jgi:hypothetical protein
MAVAVVQWGRHLMPHVILVTAAVVTVASASASAVVVAAVAAAAAVARMVVMRGIGDCQRRRRRKRLPVSVRGTSVQMSICTELSRSNRHRRVLVDCALKQTSEVLDRGSAYGPHDAAQGQGRRWRRLLVLLQVASISSSVRRQELTLIFSDDTGL